MSEASEKMEHRWQIWTHQTPALFHLSWHYYLFPEIEKELSGHHFDSDDVIPLVDIFLEVQDTDSCEKGICMLPKQWTPCPGQ